MDSMQMFIDSAIAVVFGLTAWIFKATWDELKEQKDCLILAKERIREIELNVAGSVIKREEFNKSFDQLNTKLDKIFDKLDDKMDKIPH